MALKLGVCLWAGVWVSLMAISTQAQIVPDDTLGGERSVVEVNFQGSPDDVIRGGARRGQNLFHSFQEFNVGEGRGAYFLTPSADIQNIFARVTGVNRSEILGILGTRQDLTLESTNANLFLINPNGILFGQNAQLDVGGSFLGTTADAIGFGDAEVFGARAPQVPSQVLTINPSAFLFSRTEIGSIINNSTALTGFTTPDGILTQGLQVTDGRSLLLIGGDIVMNGGRLNAFGGRIDLAGIAGVGTVSLSQGEQLKLAPLSTTSRANISLLNGASIDTSGDRGGAVQIQGNNVLLSGRSQVSSSTISQNAGDILLRANQIGLSDNSSISTFTTGAGNSGGITIAAADISLQNSSAGTNTFLGGGRSGDININADNAFSLNSSIISSFSLGRGTEDSVGSTGNILITAGGITFNNSNVFINTLLGRSDAGSLTIRADDRIELSNSILTTSSFSAGRGGDILVETGSLLSQNGSSILTSSGNAQSSLLNSSVFSVFPVSQVEFFRELFSAIPANDTTLGGGSSGDLKVTATNSIDLQGRAGQRTGFSTGTVGSGEAGTLIIDTETLSIRDGGFITTSTVGQGQGGDLSITARESTEISGSALINGQATRSIVAAETTGSGRAGNLRLETGRLTVQNGGLISASTRGSSGDAGNLDVVADSIQLSGTSSDQIFNSGIGSQSEINPLTNAMATGNAGDVTVSARTLNVQDGGFVSTTTLGQGQGGDLSITARESTEILGSALVNGQQIQSLLVTGTAGSGKAGNLRLETGRLTVQNGAAILASTRSSGNAGSLDVVADSIQISGTSSDQIFNSGIGSQSEINPLTNAMATGKAGDVTVSARTLNVQDGGFVSTATLGQGQGGDLSVIARESAEISGSVLVNGQPNRSFLGTGTTGSGRAGNLRLETGRLTVQNGAAILASTRGSGNAGNLAVFADSIQLSGTSSDQLFNSGIRSQSELNPFTNTMATGDAGNVTVSAYSLNLRDGADISTATFGSGRGGNLQVTVHDSTELLGWGTVNGQDSASGLFTLTRGTGNAGKLRLNTGELSIRRGGIIASTTSGEGNAGAIRVTVDGALTMRGNGGRQNQLVSAITSGILAGGQGNAGNIHVQARSLTLQDGARIGATVGRQEIDNQGNTIPGGRGRGGNIRVNVDDFIAISGFSRNGFSSGILSLTQRGAVGRAGNISIDTGSLSVENGGIITASTFNSGRAGGVLIDAENFSALRGGQVVTNTRNEGNAGRIEMNIDESTTVSGSDLNFPRRRAQIRRYVATQPIGSIGFDDIFINQGQRSGIFASTQERASGNGGSIEVNTTNLNLANQGAISARSSGTGQAGNIVIRAEEGRLSSNGGQITTSTALNTGGDIRITAGDIRLQDNSNITTDVGSGSGSGGNITFNADSILAFDGTAINASAQEGLTGGQGGNINFNTSALFESEDVAIEARGAITGQIDRPDVSFIQNSLADIPESPIDTDRLLANSCLNRTQQTGRFTVTGTDGLPQRPGNATQSAYPTGTIQSIPQPESSPHRPWRMGDAIVEPQGVSRLPDGRLAMERECSAPQ
jgi:filamentous hemagglutinin family protein